MTGKRAAACIVRKHFLLRIEVGTFLLNCHLSLLQRGSPGVPTLKAMALRGLAEVRHNTRTLGVTHVTSFSPAGNPSEAA